MIRTCETCVYWEREDDTPWGQSRGLCRIHPPSVQGWPETKPEDWCASHWDGVEGDVVLTPDDGSE